MNPTQTIGHFSFITTGRLLEHRVIIKFSNLGSIKETELDLRPLTVIIGPNNSNKTYIAYSVYGLWHPLRNLDGMLLRDYHEQPAFVKERGNSVSLRITNAVIKQINEITREKTDIFRKNLLDFFQDSSGSLFRNTNITLTLPKGEVLNKLKEQVGPQKLKYYTFDEEFYVPYTLSLEEDILYIDYEKNGSGERTPIIEALLLETKSGNFRIMSIIFEQLFSRPFLLPAERNAFVLTYKLLANRRYKLMKEARRGGRRTEQTRQLELLKEQGDILYPQPVEDFWDFLIDLELTTNGRMESKQKNEFQLLADDIEEYIQNKNKTVYVSTPLGGKEIKVNVKRGLTIDLHNASSSIKQLAPLLLYLRYRAAENDLLIIDEPEMGLHPESQAKFLEALAILVNLGIKVLLTTHSPYFIAHLNNLLNGEMEDERIKKKQASHLYMKDARAFLREDQVSAYEMQDHKQKGYKLCSLKDDFENFGVRWGSLSDVSADIQQKFFLISEEK